MNENVEVNIDSMIFESIFDNNKQNLELKIIYQLFHYPLVYKVSLYNQVYLVKIEMDKSYQLNKKIFNAQKIMIGVTNESHLKTVNQIEDADKYFDQMKMKWTVGRIGSKVFDRVYL